MLGKLFNKILVCVGINIVLMLVVGKTHICITV